MRAYNGFPEIAHYTFGWICQGRYCTGGGLTRNAAIDDWVKTVTEKLHSGGYYTRQAKRDAKLLIVVPLSKGDYRGFSEVIAQVLEQRDEGPPS